MGTEKSRREIIHKLKSTFSKAHELGKEPISKQKLVALISLEHGVTEAKAREYINVLSSAAYIKEIGDELSLNTENLRLSSEEQSVFKELENI